MANELALSESSMMSRTSSAFGIVGARASSALMPPCESRGAARTVADCHEKARRDVTIENFILIDEKLIRRKKSRNYCLRVIMGLVGGEWCLCSDVIGDDSQNRGRDAWTLKQLYTPQGVSITWPTFIDNLLYKKRCRCKSPSLG